MTQKIQFLFARSLGSVKCRVLGCQGLQFPKMFFVFVEWFLRSRERIKQVELFDRRKQRLVVVWSVKIDQCIADAFQDRECRRRTIDELAIRAGYGKRSLDNEVFG